MADTGNKVVTISQAARYLGKDVSGGIGDSVITLRQLRAMRDGSKATPTVLPSGYTELEYIESTGTQYIDTGFVPDQDTRVVLHAVPMSIEETRYGKGFIPYGAGVASGSRAFELYTSGNHYEFNYGSALEFLGTAMVGIDMYVDHDKNHVEFTQGSQSESADLPTSTFTAPVTMTVFGIHRSQAFEGHNVLPGHMRLMDFKIYDNGTLVRDLVPVRRSSDSVIGMFDTVGQKLYTNAGSGSFTAGPIAPPSADPRDGLVVRVSQLARIEIGPTIVSWSTGTDEEIAAMVSAADAGKINLSDYWHEGDTRTVHLSAMPGSVPNASESHAAQDVQMVLTDPGHYTLANGKKCSFVVLQKDCLTKTGVMNSQNTNSGGWNGCPRRTWCNSVYRNAIPATLRPIFKQFTTYAANGAGSTSVASSDYFALFSEKEIFGSKTYANNSAESKNSQLTWFKTSSNRIKRVNGSAYNWWERSPYSGYSNRFCLVNSGGYASTYYARSSHGLAPFGCI